MRPTRTDTASRVDTWLSRVSHLYPTRRWLLWRGLPMVILALGAVFLVWSARRNSRDVIANFMKHERNHLARDANKVATDHIGPEIARRFEILRKAVDDGVLVKMVDRFDTTKSRESLAEHELQTWVQNHREGNIDAAPSDSWFINDRQGVQIARHPLRDRKTEQLVLSFKKKYAYRNYFHGQSKDLPEDHQGTVLPIESPNLSAVYLSRNSGKLKVAFSVPIWSAKDENEKASVIGVLSMSVDLGEFEVLERYVRSSADKKIVLVDLREDYLETDSKGQAKIAKRGLILDHPLDSEWEDDQRFARVDPTVLEKMMKSPTGFVASYHDPLSADPNDTYWGAFARVVDTARYSATSENEKSSRGWVVLVQTQAAK